MKLIHFLKEIQRFMSTVPAGLSAQLSALNSEDPAVQALATQIEDQVTALKSAVAPPPPTV